MINRNDLASDRNEIIGGAKMSQKGRSLIKAAFDTDNFLMRISEKVLDIVTVNLLFVVTCLPVVTIGVAKISPVSYTHLTLPTNREV